MRRLHFVLGAMVGVWLSILPGLNEQANAEFSVGVGEIDEETRQASAIFNSALSSFHLMMASLDKRDVGSALKYQEETINQLSRASDQYAAASKRADKHVLAPQPRTPQEIADVQYFLAHAEAFGMEARRAVSQQELVQKTADLVLTLAQRVKNVDMKKMDIRQQQALTTAAVELQAFLNAVTTLLTIG